MKKIVTVIALSAVVFLVACGGGSDKDNSGGSNTTSGTPTGADVAPTPRPSQAAGSTGSGSGSGATTTTVKLSGAVTGDFKLAGLTCQPKDAANVLVSISGNVGQGQYTIGLSAPGPGKHPIAANSSINITESSPGFKVWAAGPTGGSGSVEVAQNMRSGTFQGQLAAGNGATGTITIEGTWVCT
jgi:hypothetical protein